MKDDYKASKVALNASWDTAHSSVEAVSLIVHRAMRALARFTCKVSVSITYWVFARFRTVAFRAVSRDCAQGDD